MPTLQDHQYRVAAVAKALCERAALPLPKENIVSGCLLHDMGNIIKFDLNKIPEGLTIDNLDYWKGVQKDTVAQYGSDEHHATYRMAEELGVSPTTLEVVAHIGAKHAPQMLSERKNNVLIATYSDFRVIPTGVTTLAGRIADLLERYTDTPKYEGYKRDTAVYFSIEEYLQSTLGLEDLALDSEAIETTAQSLRDFVLV